MGQSPSSCPNRYDGPIISAELSSGSRTFDIFKDSGPFLVPAQGSYTLTFVIHAGSTSSQGNTNPGDTWYDTGVYGFGDGVCVGGAGPNQNVTVSGTFTNRFNGAEWTQGVGFSTLVNGISYDIQWVKPQNPDYMVFPSTTSLTLAQGNLTNVGITVTSISNFSGTVALHASAPQGLSLSLSPQSVAVPQGGSSKANLEIVASPDASGTYPVVVTGTSGADTDSRTISVTVNTPSSPPQNLIAFSGNSKMNLVWDSPSNNGGSAVTGYQVYRGTSSGSEALLATIGNVQYYLDSTAAAGTTYYYEVKAVNSIGASPASNEAVLPASGNMIHTYASDHFGSGLGSWSYLGNPGYTLSLNDTVGEPAPSAQISGDTWQGNCSENGMAKVVDVSTLGQNPLVLETNWRATSTGPGTTNAMVSIYNADNGTRIFYDVIDAGASGDTGWNLYASDITHAVSGTAHIRVFLHLTDCWSDNWGQEDWFDNIEVFSPQYPSPSTPSSPLNLAGTGVSETQVDLSWQSPVSNGGLPISGYALSRGTSPGSESFLSNVGNVTSYNDSSASAGTTYYYRVAASNSLGTSPLSNEGRATASAPPSMNANPPSAPQDLKAVAQNTHVILSWAAPSSNGGSGIYNYDIYRGPSAGAESLLTRIGNVTSYNDSSTSVGQTYYYEISAVNTAGESPRSSEASITVPPVLPGAPSGLSAVARSSDAINLSWNAPSNNGGATITNYKVERSQDNGTTWSPLATTGSSTSYSDGGLQADTFYSYRVSAVNSVGTGPASNTAGTRTAPAITTSRIFLNDTFDSSLLGWQHYGNSGFTVSLDNTTGVPAPSAHISGYAFLGNCSKHGMYKTVDISSYSGGPLLLSLNWRASSTSGVDSTTAELRVDNAANGSELFVYPLSHTSPAYDTNWQYYRVDLSPYVKNVSAVSVDLYLYSCWDTNYNLNNWYDNISLQEGSYAPSVPTGLAGSAASSSQVNLSWNAPSANGGVPITGYKVYRGTASGGEAFLAQAGNVTSFSDTSVSASTTYYYKVSAVNSIGESVQSNEASVATPQAAGLALTNTQSTFGADSSSNQITLPSFGVGSGTGRLLVVGVGADNADVSSVTYAGISLAKAAGTFHNDDSEFWYLAGPPSGTGNVVVTLSGPAHAVVGAYAFSGADQSTPIPTSITASQSSGSPSVTISAKYQGSYVLDLPSTYGGSSLSSPTCAKSWDDTIPGGVTGASSTSVASSSPVTCSWTNSVTSNGWDDTAIEVKSSDSGSNLTFGSSNSTNVSTAPTGLSLESTQSTSGTTSSANQIAIPNFDAGTGANGMILVGVSANNNNVASVTFGGATMKKAVSSYYNNDAEVWYLAGTSGTGTITVTMAGPTQAVVGAYAFSGANQTAPIATHASGHNTSGSSPHISMTTLHPNDVMVDVPSIYGGVTLGSPTCTQGWNINMPGAITGASSTDTVASPSSTTCAWTASSPEFWDDVAVEVHASN